IELTTQPLSIRTARTPRRLSSMPQARPVGPAPTTTASNDSLLTAYFPLRRKRYPAQPPTRPYLCRRLRPYRDARLPYHRPPAPPCPPACRRALCPPDPWSPPTQSRSASPLPTPAPPPLSSACSAANRRPRASAGDPCRPRARRLPSCS